ncbi:MAG: hypothetical protein WBF53_07070, partial [Litorimonas sp.]
DTARALSGRMGKMGAGGGGVIRLEVAGTKDFYLRQKQEMVGTAVEVTEARAPAHAQSVVSRAATGTRKRQERAL